MDSNTVILEISSDEDIGWDEPRDWFSELFDTVDNEKQESDEVVIVGEVFGAKKQTNRSLGADDLDDDDCLILDCDPDKLPLEVTNDEGNGSDDLLIVGEKGQLACRDYPHPRHLCARLPFSTNPPEKYCDLCHCYVCDSRAPCIYWGTGVSNSDHCHATDKEDIWRTQRKYFKQGRTAQPPAWKNAETTLPMALPLHKSSPALTPSQPHNGGYATLHTFSKSNTHRACSSTSSFGVPGIISSRNHHQSGLSLGRNRLPHHVSKPQSLPPGSNSIVNNIIRKDRGSAGGTLGPCFVSPHVNFKRVGSPGVTLTKIRSGHGSYENNNQLYVSQPQRNHTPLNYNGVQSSRFQQDFFVGVDSELNTCLSVSQPTTSCSFDSPSYNISLQPQVYSQPIPLSSESQNTYPPENPAPNVTNQNLPEFELNWLNDTAQSHAPSSENSQHQQTSEPSPVIQSIPQCPGGINPAATDFDLDSWIQSLEPDLETVKDTVPSELGFVPSQVELVDAAMLLFDFENS